MSVAAWFSRLLQELLGSQAGKGRRQGLGASLAIYLIEQMERNGQRWAEMVGLDMWDPEPANGLC